MDDWISIEERLPEVGEEVIVNYPGGVTCNKFRGKMPNGSLDWRRFIIDAEGEVTHWRPLPEPPKVTESDMSNILTEKQAEETINMERSEVALRSYQERMRRIRLIEQYAVEVLRGFVISAAPGRINDFDIKVAVTYATDLAEAVIKATEEKQLSEKTDV